ncbi:E3 ubiquitin-protein ligase Siah2-like [Suricata suricatta]|uniref:E3 ubiquitin-protein ligase Siah2-like n=1 Tax=Suricata suricatta TaxID=37032 RepID=UPI00115607FF|nr:E3 ubiquitin-protein ligase Siah2-like [Suricata suricatta]
MFLGGKTRGSSKSSPLWAAARVLVRERAGLENAPGCGARSRTRLDAAGISAARSRPLSHAGLPLVSWEVTVPAAPEGLALPSTPPTNEDLTRLFKGRECSHLALPPIIQCESGHLVCGGCRPRLTRRPICRIRLRSIRNLALEKLAGSSLFPCKYASSGCDVTLRPAAKADPEQAASRNGSGLSLRPPLGGHAQRSRPPLLPLFFSALASGPGGESQTDGSAAVSASARPPRDHSRASPDRPAEMPFYNQPVIVLSPEINEQSTALIGLPTETGTQTAWPVWRLMSSCWFKGVFCLTSIFAFETFFICRIICFCFVLARCENTRMPGP